MNTKKAGQSNNQAPPHTISSPALQPLTAKEMAVLEFIEDFLCRNGIAPSFREICDHFGFASFNSVQRYLKQLQKKQYIHRSGGNQKRAIRILHSARTLQQQALQQQNHPKMSPNNPFVNPSLAGVSHSSSSSQGELGSTGIPTPAESLSLPLLGKVAAGQPLEAFDHNEYVDVPRSLLKTPTESFVLRVQGQSMIEDGICDGDLLLVEKRTFAKNGDIVVATIDNESTVKRYYQHQDKSPHNIELRPANSEMTSMWFSEEQIALQGIVVGLIRKF